jgi:hypothetical protein
VADRRVLFLRNGLVAGCAFAAIILLASFYSIVSGAVERAARNRPAVAEGNVAVPAALAAPAPRRVELLSQADN